MSAEEATEAPQWWTSVVPGLVIAVGAVMGGAFGVVLGAAPGAILLGGAVLVGAILLFWSSVRLLLGEKLPGVDLSDEIVERAPDHPLVERKRAALAALQDMERERELGRIGDADYDDVVLPLREQAKEVMKELDARAAPHREEAERLVAAYLKAPDAPAPAAAKEKLKKKRPSEPVARRQCPACNEGNEPDAKFCKSCGKSMESADAS